MTFFKTRQEVKYLQQKIEHLEGMLKAHFDIKYDFEDFSKYDSRHIQQSTIPVSEGEWYHFKEIISPSGLGIGEKKEFSGYEMLQYRSKNLVKPETEKEIV